NPVGGSTRRAAPIAEPVERRKPFEPFTGEQLRVGEEEQQHVAHHRLVAKFRRHYLGVESNRHEVGKRAWDARVPGAERTLNRELTHLARVPRLSLEQMPEALRGLAEGLLVGAVRHQELTQLLEVLVQPQAPRERLRATHAQAPARAGRRAASRAARRYARR